jgi:hypothetical protein
MPDQNGKPLSGLPAMPVDRLKPPLAGLGERPQHVFAACLICCSAETEGRVYSIPRNWKREAARRPHATKLLRQIIEEYRDVPYANQANPRPTRVGKSR